MANYLDELVQNIVTNCDAKGLEKFISGIEKAQRLNERFNESLIVTNALLPKTAGGLGLSAVAAKDLATSMASVSVSSVRAASMQKMQTDQSQLAYLNERQRIALARQRLGLVDKEDAVKRKIARRDEADLARMQKRNWLQRNFGRIIAATFAFNTLKNIVDTGSRIQLVQKSIEGLTKSTQDWQFVQQQAFRTGTEIEVVARGYRNFFSSAKMAGFDKNSIQGMYADTLLATRAIGASTQQTEGALLALEQMLSKGRVSMEELRKQLGNAIPGAFEIGAAAMNMTTAEFNNFVQKVGLASNEFVPKFIQKLKETYADGFKNIEQTVSVAQVRLSNSWKLLQADIMSGETGKAFAEGLNAIRELIESPAFKQLIQILGKITAITVKIISFALQHLPIILMYLGYKGINGALQTMIKYIISVQIGFFQMTGQVITFGQMGKIAFASMGTAALGLIKVLYRVLMPLIAIEDLVMFLGEYFLGWNVKSAIGAAVASATGQTGNMSFGEQLQDRVQKWTNQFDPAADYYKKGSKGYKELKKAIEEGDYTKIRQMIPEQTTIAPSGYSGNLVKQEDNKVDVKIGDINVYTDSNEPNKIALAVQNGLADLFISHGLLNNTEETVA